MSLSNASVMQSFLLPHRVQRSLHALNPSSTLIRTTPRFKVCTVNVWGLYIAKHRRKRIKAIAQKLLRSDYDVIALQELWIERDYRFLETTLINAFSFSHRFHSGIIGSGLAVFSRYPIVYLDFHSFRLNGKPLFVHHGDWFAGKGVALTRIRTPNEQLIDLYVTHMIANYGSDQFDIYAVHRCMQMVEFGKFIAASHHPNAAVIAVGDLNVDRSHNLYREVIERHMFLPDQALLLLSVWDGQKGKNTATFNRPDNSFQNPLKSPETIDHIFYDPKMVTLDSVSHAFTGNISPFEFISYSDHCAVEAVFNWESMGDGIGRVIPSEHGKYYLTQAINYADILQSRQSLLNTICLAAFLGLMASCWLARHAYRPLVIILLLSFTVIVIVSFMYANLWLNYEYNEVLKSTAEWDLWLLERTQD